MPDVSTLIVFCIAVFILTITPGPDLLYIATRGMAQGRSAGLVSALGVHTGVLVHTLAAALGLSALIATSSLAFSIVKYLGAAYLLYLGLRTLLARETGQKVHNLELVSHVSLKKIYCEGIVTNVLNPKAVLFFFAFLPQFIDPASSTAIFQTIILGLLVIVVSFPVDAAVGLCAGTLGNWWIRNVGMQRFGKWVTGTVFIGLGIGTALTGQRQK